MQVAFFCRTMHALMGAGLPLYGALRVVRMTAADYQVRRAVGDVVAAMSRGLAPSDAFREAGRRWPPVVPLVLAATGGIGNVGDVLLYIASAFEYETTYRSDIGRAALIPLITAVGALSLLGWALHIGAQQGASDSMAILSWLYAYGVYGAVGLSGGLYGVWKLAGYSMQLVAWRDRMILALPLVGRLIAYAQGILFFTVLSIVLRAGVCLVDALSAMESLFRNACWQAVLRKCVAQLREGHSLADVMQAAPRICIPAFFVATLATVTNAQSLAAVCQNAAALLVNEQKQRMALYVALLQPTLMVMVGGVIAYFLSVLYQIFSYSLGASGLV